MEKYIAIIIAMEEELLTILENTVVEKETIVNNNKIYQGIYLNTPVILALSGIGKVNASIMTTYILSTYNIDYCISIGIAGGMPNTTQGEFIICTNSYYGDFDLTHFGYEYGKVPGLEKFTTNDFSLNKIENVLQKLGVKYQIGSSASSDFFVTSPTQVKLNHPDIKCVEMESAAIIHSCMFFNINCFVLRIISDVLGKTSNHDYNEFEKNSSLLLNKFLFEFLD